MKKNSYATLLVVAGMFAGTTVDFGGAVMPTVFAASTVLRLGDQGASVITLQNDLKKAGYSLVADGSFGPATLTAVQAFQKSHGLGVDGIVGPTTWGTLDGNNSSSSSTTTMKTTSGGAAPSGTAPNLTLSSNSSHASVTYQQKRLIFNGAVLSTPMGFTLSNTAYLPIWYVTPLLDKMGVKSTWDGHHWALTLPSSMHPDLSHLPTGSAPDTISLNGVVVAKDTIAVYNDPSSHQPTTFVPIWYLMQVLDRLQAQSSWDGTSWGLQFNLQNVYTAFRKDGSKLADFTVQSEAEQALQTNAKGNPGGYVKDSQGTVVFRQPDFAAYTKANALLGDFLTETDAQALLMATPGQPGGVVRDEDQGGNIVFTAPDFSALSASGKSFGDYMTQTLAQAALTTVPAGTVRDVNGHVLFTEPDFTAYPGPLQTATDFTTQAAAEATIQSNPYGFVVNRQTNQIVRMPMNYDWLTMTGTWTSSIGTPTTPQPGYAQPGQAFMTQSSTTSSNQMFLLGQAISTGAFTYVGKVVGGYDWVDLRFPAPNSVTPAQIDSWLAANNSPLTGLGASYVDAQNQYGANATYLVAHSILETGWGKSFIALQDNNLFGYGAFDSNPGYFAGKFPSDEYAIRFEAWEVRNNYLNPGSSHYYQWPTLVGMNHFYATDSSWSTSIGQLMSQYVTQTNGSAADYVQYSPTVTPPGSQSGQEPVFLLNGAKGIIATNPYTKLPLFPDWMTGSDSMFPGTLQIGDSSSAVTHLQALLNQYGANLPTTGYFGSMTQAALISYQNSHQLSPTGIYDLATWNSLQAVSVSAYPSVQQGTQVMVDQIIQGMLAGSVTEWFHVILSNGQTGWVDSQYVQFANVYELQPSSGSIVMMYGAAPTSTTGTPTTTSTTGTATGTATGTQIPITLHQGDYVVSNSPVKDASGNIQVQIYNQDTGVALTGYVSASAVSLVQVAPPQP